VGELQYSEVQVAAAQSNLTAIAPYMFWLMFRNVASDGFVFEDPENAHVLSQPGCVLASPSWENSATNVTQDYVYNWTRDAAIVAIELAAGTVPTSQPLIDYVQFAQICQNSGGDFDLGSFFINGAPRNWSDQTDGPALQTLAILQLFSQLDVPTQAVANAVIAANLSFLQGAYQGVTVNLWEEETGASFFARAVQLQCLQAITAARRRASRSIPPRDRHDRVPASPDLAPRAKPRFPTLPSPSRRPAALQGRLYAIPRRSAGGGWRALR